MTDIRHTAIVMDKHRMKMIKWDKNPNVKLRRQYKDFITLEGHENCFEKIWHDLHPNEVKHKKAEEVVKEVKDQDSVVSDPSPAKIKDTPARTRENSIRSKEGPSRK